MGLKKKILSLLWLPVLSRMKHELCSWQRRPYGIWPPTYLSLPHTSYAPNTLPVCIPPTHRIRSRFRAFATAVPSTRKLFALLFVWPAPFGQQNCYLRRKDFVPAHPEKATRQPLLNTFPSPRGVRVLGRCLFILQGVCMPSFKTPSSSHWMEPV